jgi:hypothetical protein
VPNRYALGQMMRLYLFHMDNQQDEPTGETHSGILWDVKGDNLCLGSHGPQDVIVPLVILRKQGSVILLHQDEALHCRTCHSLSNRNSSTASEKLVEARWYDVSSE